MAKTRSTEIPERARRFADAYFVSMNALEALKAAGYAGNSDALRKQSYRLLTDDRVQTYLETRRAKLVQATDHTLLEVIAQLKTIAFANIKDVASWTTDSVDFKPSSEIPSEQAQAIRRVKGRKRPVFGKDGEKVGESLDFELELHNKEAALKLLASYYGIDSDWNSIVAGLARFNLVLKEDSNQPSGWRVDRLEKG
ncbi:MAG: terminase small subunit [Phormidium tanganyikae FI6-MK23]|jgi:phage terminase small subunit|nr:terminase small subunit [Phormidium tanganyikae FI6-MK23]